MRWGGIVIEGSRDAKMHNLYTQRPLLSQQLKLNPADPKQIEPVSKPKIMLAKKKGKRKPKTQMQPIVCWQQTTERQSFAVPPLRVVHVYEFAGRTDTPLGNAEGFVSRENKRVRVCATWQERDAHDRTASASVTHTRTALHYY